jgi:hypothetical protein
VTGIAVERDAGRVQRLDVPVHGAHRDLQLGRKLGGRHPAAILEQEQNR